MIALSSQFLTYRAEDIMNPEPQAIMAYSLLSEAIDIMSENNFSSLPVISSQGHLLGVLSQSDIIQAIQSPDCDLEEARVREIMNANIFSVKAHTLTQEVVQSILENHIHRVLVTDDEEKLLGIISTIDLLKALTKEE